MYLNRLSARYIFKRVSNMHEALSRIGLDIKKDSLKFNLLSLIELQSKETNTI